MAREGAVIKWRRTGKITFVEFMVDRLTDLILCREATEQLRNLADSFGGHMILSLANVRFMSSVGVSVLVLFNQQLEAVGGQLKICDIQPLIKNLFTSIELEKAIDLCHTQQQAMIAFNTGR